MSKIEEMLNDFKDIVELKEFSKAQHKTIIELTKKVRKLEEEKKELENKSQNNSSGSSNSQLIIQNSVEYQELICRNELKKLNDLSLERALTYEEAKKVDIYTKLLISLGSKTKGEDVDTKSIETGTLLTLVSGNDNKSE